ncbi:actin family [Piptocephalis cylindrospora]|uniref:Actin family n=1 Tax=Piptocephalis cylindrospora TaxID=1907219 RepID=A0A4P9Y4N0_9FUNG|nr:actin family [Piptocephalis cylindrospora]|eukprot:RKP13111.1 actin family [Piptocephalis cylindrospora]
MQSLLREEQYVILELGSYTIRAHKGVQDLLGRSASLTSFPARYVKPPPNRSEEESAEEFKELEEEGLLLGSALLGAEEGGATWDNSRLVQPIQRGRIVDWEGLEELLKHVIVHILRVPTARNSSPLLLAIPETTSLSDREKLAQVAFEKLNTPALLLIEQPMCALYGVNTMSGLVVDIGHETIHIVPILDTAVQAQAAIELPLGGRDLEECFLDKIRANPSFQDGLGDTKLDQAFVRALKESGHCSILPPGKQSNTDKKSSDETFEYNGQTITLNRLRHQMAEPLFDPLGHGLKAIPGLAQAVHLSLSYLDPERRALLRERVLLTGGASQFPGLADRLERDLRGLVPTPESGERVESIVYSEIPRCFRDWREDPQCPALLGGSILAKVAFGDVRNYISKADYNEHGPAIVRTKGSG